MSTPPILKLLKDVCPSEQNKFTACCPAHDDSTVHLGVRVEHDGRPVFHCWGGCNTESVLKALSVAADDLVPLINAKNAFLKPIHLPFDHFDALVGLRRHLQEVQIYTDQLSKGIAPSATAMDRLTIISQRFYAAHTYINTQSPCEAGNDLVVLCMMIAEVLIYAKQLSNGIEFSTLDQRRLSVVSARFDATHDRVDNHLRFRVAVNERANQIQFGPPQPTRLASHQTIF